MNLALIYQGNNSIKQEHEAFVRTLSGQTSREFLMQEYNDADLETFCEAQGIDMLFISCKNKKRDIQQWLNRSRVLRLPYVFLTDTMMHIKPLHSILSPVSMLEEEVHKAETLIHLARFTAAETILLQANDYGSRAEQNTNRIKTALDSFNLKSEVIKAKKNSFSVVKEAAERQKEFAADLLVLTASREYGLDDMFFGPQERHAIAGSNCPVLLLNPRGDLFSLCD